MCAELLKSQAAIRQQTWDNIPGYSTLFSVCHQHRCMSGEVVNNELHSKKCARMRLWCNLRQHLVVFPEEMRKPTTYAFFSQNRRFPSADLSPGSPEFEAVLYSYKCQVH